jgi:hypothetical protein
MCESNPDGVESTFNGISCSVCISKGTKIPNRESDSWCDDYQVIKKNYNKEGNSDGKFVDQDGDATRRLSSKCCGGYETTLYNWRIASKAECDRGTKYWAVKTKCGYLKEKEME